MPKLHEILAIEPDRKKTAETILEETKVTFEKRQDHFTGLHKSYKPDNEQEAQIEQPVEIKAMVETVVGKLKHLAEHQSALFDILYLKEEANTRAKADLVLDTGVLIAKNIPATVLLALEGRLKALRDVYMAIPTLAPGEDWATDENQGVYVVTEKKVRTKKVLKNHIVSPATDKHPAQVSTYSEDERTGLAVTVKTTSVLSPADKSELLTRLDRLQRAVKQARQRANNESVVEKTDLADKVFEYLHSI